jgi:hypothetical protein
MAYESGAMNKLDKDYEEGLTGAGTRALVETEVLSLLEHLSGRNTLVQSMEAFRIDPDGDLSMVEYSILGLEPDSVWSAHNDQSISFELVRSKLNSAGTEANPMKYMLWFREF